MSLSEMATGTALQPKQLCLSQRRCHSLCCILDFGNSKAQSRHSLSSGRCLLSRPMSFTNESQKPRRNLTWFWTLQKKKSSLSVQTCWTPWSGRIIPLHILQKSDCSSGDLPSAVDAIALAQNMRQLCFLLPSNTLPAISIGARLCKRRVASLIKTLLGSLRHVKQLQETCTLLLSRYWAVAQRVSHFLDKQDMHLYSLCVWPTGKAQHCLLHHASHCRQEWCLANLFGICFRFELRQPLCLSGYQDVLQDLVIVVLGLKAWKQCPPSV